MLRNHLNNNPNNLTNEDIQAIGKKYLQKKSIFSFFLKTSTLDTFAEKLKEYNAENEAYQKWLYLAELYKELPNKDNLIANEIRSIFGTAFNLKESYCKRLSLLHPRTVSQLFTKVIDEYFNRKNKFIANDDNHKDYLSNVISPNKLTIEIINQIGLDYLQKHGNNAAWISCMLPLHTNHIYARKLRDCKEPNCERRWLFVAKIVESLPNTRGELAKAIITLFKNAYPAKISQLNEINSKSDPIEVADELRAIIKNKHRNLLSIKSM